MKICTFPECGRGVLAKNLCQGHYNQNRRGEELRPINWQNKKRRMSACVGPECENNGPYGGHCWSHFQQVKVGEPLRPLYRQVPEVCHFEGCDHRAASRGLCQSHARQLKRTGELRQIRIPTYRWKGDGGYVLVKAIDHPNAQANGRMFEHVKVMSDMLGRPLRDGENVHHINGVRNDNRPENLELWSTKQPKGQRIPDKVAWAVEFLAEYAPEKLAAEVRAVTQP